MHADILSLVISGINVFAVTTATFPWCPGLVWRAAGRCEGAEGAEGCEGWAVRGAALSARPLHPGLSARPLGAFKPRGSQSAQRVPLPAANQRRTLPSCPLGNLRSVPQQTLCVCPGNLSQPIEASSMWVAGAATNPSGRGAQGWPKR